MYPYCQQQWWVSIVRKSGRFLLSGTFVGLCCQEHWCVSKVGESWVSNFRNSGGSLLSVTMVGRYCQ